MQIPHHIVTRTTAPIPWFSKETTVTWTTSWFDSRSVPVGAGVRFHSLGTGDSSSTMYEWQPILLGKLKTLHSQCGQNLWTCSGSNAFADIDHLQLSTVSCNNRCAETDRETSNCTYALPHNKKLVNHSIANTHRPLREARAERVVPPFASKHTYPLGAGDRPAARNVFMSNRSSTIAARTIFLMQLMFKQNGFLKNNCRALSQMMLRRGEKNTTIFFLNMVVVYRCGALLGPHWNTWMLCLHLHNRCIGNYLWSM